MALRVPDKTTLTHFLKHLIKAESGFTVTEFSLDDYYSTRSDREELAQSVHLLFLTRGVPGTHDIQLIENTLSKLLHGEACLIPHFNKTVDDRYTEKLWTFCKKNTDIILFEGWVIIARFKTRKNLQHQ